MSNTVVILIPGTTATSLIDPGNSKVAWGGTPSEVQMNAYAGQASAADQILEQPLNVGTPAGWVPAQPSGYGAFQMLLANTYGFATAAITGPNDVPSPIAQKQLLGFGYDWRVSNKTTAGVLQSVIQKIDNYYSGQGYQTWLVGHSMGGLVARALLESNATSTATWYKNIAGLITLGTPHFGAPLALQAILNQLPGLVVPLYLDPVIVNFVNYNGANGLYDSTYELLPPPGVPFISTQGQQKSAFDLQSVIVAAGGSPSNFAAALAFFNNVLANYTGATPPATPKPYYCAYGSDLPTTCSFTYTPPNTWQAQLGPFLLGGDGIVPMTSASFSGVKLAGSYEAVAVTHIGLVTNHGVLGQVTKWMGLSATAGANAA